MARHVHVHLRAYRVGDVHPTADMPAPDAGDCRQRAAELRRQAARNDDEALSMRVAGKPGEACFSALMATTRRREADVWDRAASLMDAGKHIDGVRLLREQRLYR